MIYASRFMVLLICLFLLDGCGVTRKNGTDGHQVKEVTKETPTADGGKVIEKTVTYNSQQEEVERSEADPTFTNVVGTMAPFAGSVIGMATGTPGLPWGEILGGLATSVAVGWGALKHGQGNGLRDQVEFHKNDADEAYKKLLEASA